MALAVSCAQPTSHTATITYEANGADAGSPPIDVTDYSPGATVVVQGSGSLSRTDYAFEGWNSASDGAGTTYPVGSHFTIGSSNFTLYAVWATGVKVIVLDSVNGSALAGATVTALDSTGAVAETEQSLSDGSALFTTLITNSAYTLQARFSGRAASDLVNFIAAPGEEAGLYCYALGISGTQATPPHIEAFQYSTDGGTTWTPLAMGSAATTLVNGGFKIRAVSAGVVAVRDTSWSGFGIGLDVDRMPTWANYIEVPDYVETAQPVTSSDDFNYSTDVGLFQTEADFNFSTITLGSGSHILDLVSYDVANNRVEERVNIVIQ